MPAAAAAAAAGCSSDIYAVVVVAADIAAGDIVAGVFDLGVAAASVTVEAGDYDDGLSLKIVKGVFPCGFYLQQQMSLLKAKV